MEFRQLKTFRVVAEKLSFTGAAELLHMAQSSVSAQIRNLEEELGVVLFDRIGRSVLLTDAGRKLLDYACRLEGMTEEIRSEISGDKYLRGSLTIRVPDTLATVYMPAVISIYHQKYPDVALNFIHCSDTALPQELNSGRIDLAFLMTDTIQSSEVNVRYFKTESLGLYASPKHPLTDHRNLDLTDLEGETLLLPKTD